MVEVIEGEAVEISNQPAPEHPFFLVIEPDDKSNGNIGIELDEPGWMRTHAEAMRIPGYWILIHRQTGSAILVMRVDQGDQPYYTRRHIGSVMGGAGEIVCHGIGKKMNNGEVMRMWIMPNGMICGGDDVDSIGVKLLNNR